MRNRTDFVGYYWREFAALSNPATPFFSAAAYCLTLFLVHYYRENVYLILNELLSPGSLFKKEPFIAVYLLEGIWYFVGPSLTIIAIVIVTSISCKAKSVFPVIGFRAFGLCIGTSSGWRDALVFFAVMAPVIIATSLLQDFSAYYPLSGLARSSVQWFMIWQAVQLIFFLGWEFLNRGLLLLGFESSLGRWSVIAAAVPFFLLHLGKPGPEAFGSFFAAMALGWLTLRARSVMPAVALHWACAFTLDVVAMINRGGFLQH